MLRDRLYEAPQLVDMGSIAELTQAQHSGSQLDNDYQAGTPLSKGILS